MEKLQFWQLIDQSRGNANGDPKKQLKTLSEALEVLTADEIVEFNQIFYEYFWRAYTWPLWGAAYLIGGGCSDDSFMDFRGWLISRGEKVYEAALASPDSLAHHWTESDGNCRIEGYQDVASDAWESKTGKSFVDFPLCTSKAPCEPIGKEWNEDELVEMFPKLAARFALTD